ncbi:hypothetical protein B6U99_02720 [Candidatus Geothermarchaeota archaeon ex4572_27]|nr:MAG: hypothetical protein B6U99_02720 [Candidatus Geothermarchaeota archaeon ex4572_27]
MPVRIGLVGVGRWGEVHLRKLLELRSRGVAEPSGIHDVDRDRARLVSREYGVPSMELDELLRESDGVIVATPPSAHHRVAMKAIERGLPVLVEKPMTNDPRRAEEIVRAARSRGVEVDALPLSAVRCPDKPAHAVQDQGHRGDGRRGLRPRRLHSQGRGALQGGGEGRRGGEGGGAADQRARPLRQGGGGEGEAAVRRRGGAQDS